MYKGSGKTEEIEKEIKTIDVYLLLVPPLISLTIAKFIDLGERCFVCNSFSLYV